MLAERVANGEKFKIDLINKNLIVGKNVIMKGGEVNEEFAVETDDNPSWEKVEELYEKYKYSVPHEREIHSYFKALTADELTDEQLVNGEDRYLAQFNLEYYLLVNGDKLKMIDPKHWFWQGKDRDLVVIKEWL